ncbi:MAG: hypothetical protein AAFX99_35655, partial [Myxococcota bacterium]
MTDEELARATGPSGELDREAFRAIVEQWTQTEHYRTKRRRFLMLALHHDNEGGQYLSQMGGPLHFTERDGLLLTSLHEMFLRTMERILDEEGGDFRKLFTTTEYEVTTALLVALTYADVFNMIGSNGLHKEIEDYPLSDFTDWRTVRIVRDLDALELRDLTRYSDPDVVATLRSIGEGDEAPFWAPRVGFFTTPTFLQVWNTNLDNQFRVVANQTLIAALGMTFDIGDVTVPNHLDGLDDTHSDPSTACYACHDQLDPMRNAWRNVYYDHNSRAARGGQREFPEHQPDFAFQGSSREISDLYDLGEALVEHPRFPIAWVLKVCHWANSAPCDARDPVIQALADQFVASGYHFDDLMVRVLSSEAVTNVSTRPEESTVATARPSMARFTHYCHRMKVRIQDLAAGSYDMPNYEGEVCTAHIGGAGARRSIAQLASGIPDDSNVRGEVDFLTPSDYDPLGTIVYAQLCQKASERLIGRVGRDDDRLFYPEDAMDKAIECLLDIIGI